MDFNGVASRSVAQFSRTIHGYQQISVGEKALQRVSRRDFEQRLLGALA